MRKQIYLITTTLLLLFVLLPFGASAQKRSSAEEAQRKALNNIKKELNTTTKRVDSLKNKRGAASRHVEELNREINLRSSVIAETEYEIELVEGDITSLSNSIDSLEAAFNKSRDLYAEMVRQSYRMNRRNTYATYLFSSTSLEEFSRRMAAVERFAERYKSVATTARQQRNELAQVRENLQLRLVELDSINLSLESEREALNKNKREAQRAYDDLSKQEREALARKKEQEAEYKQADAKLKKILAENTVGSSFSSNTRGLKLPIDGGRIRPLQPNMIEISGPRGAPVRCVEAGTVGEVTLSRGGHYIVKVAHGKDFFTVYTHVSKVCVKVGQKLEVNQQIGIAGVFVDYDGSERSFIQFMVHNHRTGQMEEVMKFFSSK